MKRDINTCQFTPRDDFANLTQFYPYYLQQHSNNLSRLLHFIGTTLTLICVILFILKRSPWYILYAILSAYSFAWVGHFFFEKNKPATFSYPLKSLLCDFIMFYKIATRQLHNDFKKFGIRNIKVIDTELF
jgi:hypothetical protein